MPINVLVFSGSLHINSYNDKTADAVQKELKRQSAASTRISLADFPLPIFDQDMENREGIPENAFKLARLFVQHDAIVFCTPEYNASVPPLLKNMIDWLSRIRTDKKIPLLPFKGKTAAICSASPGSLGGIRGAEHLRAILFSLHMEIVPFSLFVANASEAFDPTGDFREEKLQNNLFTLCLALIENATMRSARLEI